MKQLTLAPFLSMMISSGTESQSLIALKPWCAMHNGCSLFKSHGRRCPLPAWSLTATELGQKESIATAIQTSTPSLMMLGAPMPDAVTVPTVPATSGVSELEETKTVYFQRVN